MPKNPLMRLFRNNSKPNVTRLNNKEEYYKNYYFNRKLSEGIELVAKIEKTSEKNAAELLMERGLASYIGNNMKYS